MRELADIVEELTSFEQERLTGWQGVGGAAYNMVSEDLCSQGLLKRDWSLSLLGEQVRDYILQNKD